MKKHDKKYAYSLNTKTIKDTIPLLAFGDDFFIADNLYQEVDYTAPSYKESVGRVEKHEDLTGIVVCLNGVFGIKVNGRDASLHGGEALFLNNNVITEGGEKSADCKFILMICSTSLYEPPLNSTEALQLLSLMDQDPVCHIVPQDLNQIVQLYIILRSTLLNRNDISFAKRTAMGLVQAIYFQIFMAYRVEARPEDDRPLTANQKRIYRQYVDLVAKHFTAERNISFYADRLCVTPKYLSQVVLLACGYPASDVIDHHVIAEAKMLLRSKQYTVAQISDMLNFTCQSYFGRFFKRITGITPGEYQNQF